MVFVMVKIISMKMDYYLVEPVIVLVDFMILVMCVVVMVQVSIVKSI